MIGLVSFISLVIVSFKHYLSEVSGLTIDLKISVEYTGLRSDEFFAKISEHLIKKCKTLAQKSTITIIH